MSAARSGVIETEDPAVGDPWEETGEDWAGLPATIRLPYVDVMHERLSGRRRYARPRVP